MKWLPVQRVNLLLIVAILIVAISPFVWQSLTSPSMMKGREDVEGTFQMGFYDLKSQSKEIYDSQLVTTKGTILATIISPNDGRFVLKGTFTPVKKRNNKLYFYLTPIYYSKAQNSLLIDSLVDLLMHTTFWMEPLSLSNQPLVVGESGAIFLYPLKKK